MAVHRYESLLSSYEREQYFIENGFPPRAVTMENHDKSYINMLKTIGEIEKNQLFDKIKIFKRGYNEERPELIYVNGDPKYINTIEALTAEREKNKQELLQNSQQFLQRIQNLKERIEKNDKSLEKSTAIQIEKIEKLEMEFLEELKKEKEEEQK